MLVLLHVCIRMDDAFRRFFTLNWADEEVRTRLKQVLLVNWRVVLELAVVRNAFVKNGFSEAKWE